MRGRKGEGERGQRNKMEEGRGRGRGRGGRERRERERGIKEIEMREGKERGQRDNRPSLSCVLL